MVTVEDNAPKPRGVWKTSPKELFLEMHGKCISKWRHRRREDEVPVDDVRQPLHDRGPLVELLVEQHDVLDGELLGPGEFQAPVRSEDRAEKIKK